MSEKRIAVAGAGITGLTISLKLQQMGFSVDLFDRRDVPGGVIKTEKNESWKYEYGPNTLLLKDPEVEDFLYELGLEQDIREANPDARKRFIVKEGKLHPLPASLKDFVKTPLFSSRAKLRLLGELFPRRSVPDSTIAQFFQHRFGSEILDYAVNPFIAGIHAGTPENLSLKHSFPLLYELEQGSGSITVGAIKKVYKNRRNRKTKRRLISFKNGLQHLPENIFSKLDETYLNHEIEKFTKTDDGWILETPSKNFGPYHDVVITVPVHKWNSKFLPLNQEDLDVFDSIEHPALSVMILGYKKSQVKYPLDGFGFLVPEKEKRFVLGALFTSTLFDDRAPEGHHLLSVFVGGSRQPKFAKLDSEELLAKTENDLSELIGLKGTAVFKDHIFWPNSIPQYHKNYDRVIERFKSVEKRNSGLHLAGNFRGGISVPDCIKNGIKIAEKVSAGKQI